MLTLEELKAKGKAPLWMTDEGYQTLLKGYLLPDEAPYDLYMRVANAAASRLKRLALAPKFFNLFWRGWLGLATPVAANLGTDKGLPISCFSGVAGDSIESIAVTQSELMALSAAGGGTAVYMGGIRPAGQPIRNGGVTADIIPWAKIYDSTILATNQGATRRGACAVYLDVTHGDIDPFLRMRRPQGDVNRQCLNLHHGVGIPDSFMEGLKAGSKENRRLWAEILKTRVETGEPYLFFIDNVNRGNPQRYKELGLKVKASNLCTEVMGYTDELHTFVCCLSSLNLFLYDEWKDTDAVELSIWFLDGVLQEFIDKTEGKFGFERARNFAIKSRMLGLGVLGWHSLLQAKGIAFDSAEADKLNEEVFRTVRNKADKASRDLYKEYGGCEWADEGYRNSHRLAIAPTVSNSAICGGHSAGIEPVNRNVNIRDGAKGKFVFINNQLVDVLKERGLYSESLISEIAELNGSVQWLKGLTDHDKAVFKTAVEIDQMAIVEQAAARQKWIDQGQSLNLFFDPETDPKVVNKVHYRAWEAGLKTLYYLRSRSILKADKADREVTEAKRDVFAPVGQPLEFRPAAVATAEEKIPGFCSLAPSDGSGCQVCEG